MLSPAAWLSCHTTRIRYHGVVNCQSAPREGHMARAREGIGNQLHARSELSPQKTGNESG